MTRKLTTEEFLRELDEALGSGLLSNAKIALRFQINETTVRRRKAALVLARTQLQASEPEANHATNSNR
jgi:hypothetical protein